MELAKGFQSLTHPVKNAVITIGNFDGVHLGHQQIIELAKKKAEQKNGQCIVYTFRPHPQVALNPSRNVALLSTYDEKIELLEQLGVDLMIEEPFSREFSTIEPDQFFHQVLLGKLSAQAIVVGYDFAFGRERHGHLDSLKKFCQQAGVELNVVAPHRVHSEVVSSSRIRQYLMSGEVSAAHRLLGRPFFYRGIVVKGEGRGRKIGFPTANLKVENKLTLPYGVYVTQTLVNGKIFPSVTNVGVRPTFEISDKELPVLVETHLLDVRIDLYGTPVEVRFLSRLRDEKKFNSIDDLTRQIQLDIADARKVLSQ